MYLGIDLGTSSVKVTLIGEDAEIVASSTASLTVARPHDGWSEQQPTDWISATTAAIDELRSGQATKLAAVKGIGLSGQMHGATLLDAEDQPLRPCMLWNDTRAYVEASTLDRDPVFRALTGNIVFPGFTAPKLLWVKNHEPRVFDAIHSVLLPKDFLRLWLTGERATDMSDASGTCWLETGKRRWSEDLLAATGIDMSRVPRLVEGTEPSGQLRAAVAEELGMHPGIVVAGGAGDNAASACGIGAVDSGSAFLSLGTSGVLFVATDCYLPNPESAVHAFCHALPERWHQMGVMLSATDSLNWLASVVGREPAELAATLGDELRAPSAVTFLPYLSGERTPHNDALIRGAFLGLGHESGLTELTQAVVEGVALACRENLEALEAAGTVIDRVMAVGGGSKSRYWLRAVATALNVPVDVPSDGDYGAAFGAARLGLIAAESVDHAAICQPPAVAATIEPDAAQLAAYELRYERFRAMYGSVRAGMNEE